MGERHAQRIRSSPHLPRARVHRGDAAGDGSRQSTCPASPIGQLQTMVLTPFKRSGELVLLAEGRVDSERPPTEKFSTKPLISEIWIRSPAEMPARHAAGLLIRKVSKNADDHPHSCGWTVSARAILCSWAAARGRSIRGHFLVHIFTMTGDKAHQSSVALALNPPPSCQRCEREAALMATEDMNCYPLDVSRDLLRHHVPAESRGDGQRPFDAALSDAEGSVEIQCRQY